jgi:hypothetical protein
MKSPNQRLAALARKRGMQPTYQELNALAKEYEQLARDARNDQDTKIAEGGALSARKRAKLAARLLLDRIEYGIRLGWTDQQISGLLNPPFGWVAEARKRLDSAENLGE